MSIVEVRSSFFEEHKQDETDSRFELFPDETTFSNNNKSPPRQLQKCCPWDSHHPANFLIDTEILPSSVQGGGLGRFASSPAKRGDIICVFSAVYTAREFVAVHEPGTITADETYNIRIEHPDDMDLLLEHFAAAYSEDDNKNKEDHVAKMLSWFIAGYPPVGTPQNPDNIVGATMGTHSVKTNHSAEKANFEIWAIHGKYTFRATKDIYPGDELFMDYKKFQIPACIKQWMAKRGLHDTQTLAATWDGIETD